MNQKKTKIIQNKMKKRIKKIRITQQETQYNKVKEQYQNKTLINIIKQKNNQPELWDRNKYDIGSWTKTKMGK